MMKKFQTAFAWAVLTLGGAWMLASMTACHTVEGAGRDVGALGEGVADTAEDARPYDNP